MQLQQKAWKNKKRSYASAYHEKLDPDLACTAAVFCVLWWSQVFWISAEHKLKFSKHKDESEWTKLVKCYYASRYRGQINAANSHSSRQTRVWLRKTRCHHFVVITPAWQAATGQKLLQKIKGCVSQVGCTTWNRHSITGPEIHWSHRATIRITRCFRVSPFELYKVFRSWTVLGTYHLFKTPDQKH